MSEKSKGLGDTIAKITKATGIDKVAKKVLGDDCGCEERKAKLNKMFPYARTFTPDEMSIYESIIPQAKKENKLSKAHYAILLPIYNKVFNKKTKPTSCGSCVAQMLFE